MISGACAARIPGVCAGPAQHRHHRKLRRHGDNSDSNLLPVCFACHDHIHRHPEWSRSWGLIVASWDDPFDRHPHRNPDPERLGPETETHT